MPVKFASKSSKKSVGKVTKSAPKKAAKPAVKKSAQSPARTSATAAKVRRKTKVQQRTIARSATRSVSIVETSPVTWSRTSNGPTFEQVQLAAYHRWLQAGGSEFDNWISAEGKLRDKKDS